MHRPPGPGLLAAAGIVVMLLGILPSWWFTATQERDGWDGESRSTEISLGLKTIAYTNGEGGGEVALTALPRPDEDDDEEMAAFRKLERYAFVAELTWWLGVMTSIMLGVAGMMWLTRQRLPIPTGGITAALAVATAVLAVITLVSKPVIADMEGLRFSASLGGPFTLIGAALAGAGGAMISKLEKTFPPFGGAPQAGYAPGYPPGYPPVQPPGYPPPPPPPPPQYAIPACPRCSVPTAFVHEYQRWFCHSCRVYL